MKWAEILVVSLAAVDQGFYSHLLVAIIKMQFL